MGYKVIDKYKVRDTRFGRKPRNAVEALRQARDFLIQEGKDHWIKGTLMAVKDDNALVKRRFNPKDPSWSQWGVCAVGAVALVTGDMEITVAEVSDDEGDRIYFFKQVNYKLHSPYHDAVCMLDDVVGNLGIMALNDAPTTRRQTIINRFNDAIELAKKRANLARGRNAARTKMGWEHA